MSPSATKIFCLHESDVPSLQCLERQVGSGDLNCQSLGVLPGSAVEIRNASELKAVMPPIGSYSSDRALSPLTSGGKDDLSIMLQYCQEFCAQ